MSDDQIIELFVARDERAITETNTKYRAYCMQIVSRILSDQQDAEEVVNDMLLRAWDTIPNQRPVVLKLYLARIARNLAFSRFRAQNAEKRGGGELVLALDELEDCIAAADDPAADMDAKELTDAIQRFLETVSFRDRNIFIRRYFFVDSVSDIAARYGLRESNIHMILMRIRKKLKVFLMKEGFCYEE